MTKTYECMFLLDNREVRQGWEPLKTAVTGMITKHGGEIVSARHWDERRLAYSIRGQTRGTYLLVYYKGEPESNAAVRREIELSEAVLRHIILACDEVPEEAFEPEAEFDVNAIPEDGEEPAAEAEASDDREGDAKAKSEKPGKSDKAESDKAESDKSEAEKSEKSEEAEKSEKSDKAENAENADEPAAVAPDTGETEPSKEDS